MQRMISPRCTAAPGLGALQFDTPPLLVTIKRQHLKGKLEKALAHEDSIAQSAKQAGSEVTRSSHISASKKAV